MIKIKKSIVDRIKYETEYILKTNETIREVAKKFKVSKSTVHKDLHERLKDINSKIYNDVKELMKKHIEIRHINGGEATKNKYKVTEK